MTAPIPTEKDAHALATEAHAKATEALAKANEALDRCDRSEAAVAGNAAALTRVTNEVLEMKRINGVHHDETLAAIEGAKRADAARAQKDSLHDERIKSLESKLTALDLLKITLAGGGGSFLVALILGVLALFVGRPLPPQTPALAPVPALVAPTPGAASP